MRTLIKIWIVGLLTIMMLIGVGCAAFAPSVDPNLQAQRDIAWYDAMAAEQRAVEMASRIELAQVEGDVHIRKVHAETSARIVEMHEMVTADMERLLVNQNAFVDAINNHQAAMMNQSYLLQQQFAIIESIDYNAHAAAENSWFANLGVIALAVVILGLIGLVIALAMRFERRLSSI